MADLHLEGPRSSPGGNVHQSPLRSPRRTARARLPWRPATAALAAILLAGAAVVMAATGQKAFDMAFILASGGSCAPAWDGTDPVSADTQVAGVINGIRSGGGDVIVSAGGYNGTKLGQVCS